MSAKNDSFLCRKNIDATGATPEKIIVKSVPPASSTPNPFASYYYGAKVQAWRGIYEY